MNDLQEAVLVRDVESYGVYPMPVTTVHVDPIPGEVSAPPTSWVHTATLVNDKCVVTPASVQGTRDIRVLGSMCGPVFSWTKMSQRSAFAWLTEALPNYWLNRHRLTTEIRDAIQAGLPIAVNSSPKRPEERARLAQHANSMKCKMWTLEYHRGKFATAIQGLESSPDTKNLHLIRINAEFTAHDNEAYALLEELSRVLAIMMSIRTGGKTPTSFHDLHSRRVKQDAALRIVLNDMPWYEAFRMRRANSTHTYKTYSSVHPATNEALLWQHPDRQIFSTDGMNLNGDSAADVMRTFVTQFDETVARLSEYLLTLFHPFDLVTMHHKPDRESPIERTIVWVRRLRFSPPSESEWDGSALLDPQGTFEIRTAKGGGIETAPASRLPGAK